MDENESRLLLLAILSRRAVAGRTEVEAASEGPCFVEAIDCASRLQLVADQSLL